MPNVQITEQPLWLALRQQRTGDTPANRILRWFGIVSPPIDVEKIAVGLGFRIHADPTMGDYSGSVDLSRLPAIIRLRDPQVDTRRRFTIAHEIGHAMLHDLAHHHRDDTFTGSAQEIQANRFAAELLMPDWMVGPASMSSGMTSSRLAALFGVSQEAMNYRLRTIGTPR